MVELSIDQTGEVSARRTSPSRRDAHVKYKIPQTAYRPRPTAYNVAYGTGEITTADLALTNGFSLDYPPSYDGSGNEIGYAVNEYDPSDQPVWTGDYSASGTYLSGSGEYGYYGAGGYYGGSDGGYGGGYDFVKNSPQRNSSKGSNINEIAAHDVHQGVQPITIHCSQRAFIPRCEEFFHARITTGMHQGRSPAMAAA